MNYIHAGCSSNGRERYYTSYRVKRTSHRHFLLFDELIFYCTDRKPTGLKLNPQYVHYAIL